MITMLLLTQESVLAEWTGPPNNPPDGNITFEFVHNPMAEDLDLGNNDLINGGTASFSGNVQVGTLNGEVPVFGSGDVSNPMTGNLDAGNYNITNLDLLSTNRLNIKTAPLNIIGSLSHDNEEKWAFGATAGKNMSSQGNNGYTYGLYAQTSSNSGSNPSYAVYAISNNLGGTAILADATSGWAGYFRGLVGIEGKTKIIGPPGDEGMIEIGGVNTEANRQGSIAIGVQSTVNGRYSTAIGYGVDIIDPAFRSMVLGNGINVSGSYSLGIGLDATDRQVTDDNVMSIMGGNVGVNVLNPNWNLEVNGTIYSRSDTMTPIIGWGVSGSDFANSGVTGVGDIGVYAFGDNVGLYADGKYGAIIRGTVPTSIDPPDDPSDLPSYNPISRLFGVEQILADVNTPAALGSVTIGGYIGGGTLEAAGLGICSLSGEKAWEMDGVNDYDYYTYCQDSSGTNNYAGFFAGDVYLKDGSLQIYGDLDSSNENLIYANTSSAVSGSHLIKLQQAGSDKFKVNKDGDGYFAGDLVTDSLNLADGSLFLNKDSAYIDFQGGGASGPTCKSGSEGIVYYFSNYNALCICRGADGWSNLIHDEPDGECTNGAYHPH